MTRWRDTSNQVDRSLYIQPLLGVSCSAMDTSSALNTCEYFATLLCACLWYEHHYSVCVFGVASHMKSFSSNNSHHTSCIHKGWHAGKWPDLMTSKPDYVSTLGYHWTDHTGRPLEPQVHWDATGATLADASTQWRSSVNLHNWNTLEDHWSHRYTGMPLEPHWLMLAPSGVPVAIQC